MSRQLSEKLKIIFLGPTRHVHKSILLNKQGNCRGEWGILSETSCFCKHVHTI